MKKALEKNKKVIVTYIEKVGKEFLPKVRNYHNDEEKAKEFVNTILINRNVIPNSICIKTYNNYDVVETEE